MTKLRLTMPLRIYSLALLAAALVLPACPAMAINADDINGASVTPGVEGKSKPAKSAKKLPDPRIVKAQVLLDRRRISPGVIDGYDGENFRKAIAELRRREKLPDGKKLDADVWRALEGDAANDIVMEYTVTERDVAYKFAPTPKDYGELATLKTIGYRAPSEMIGERFHMDEDLVRDLNPKIEDWQAGDRLTVTKVYPGPLRPAPDSPVEGKPVKLETRTETKTETAPTARAERPEPRSEHKAEASSEAKHEAKPAPKVAHIVISRGRGMVSAFDEKDTVLAVYPATVGSTATPTPLGHYTVKGVAKNPTYTYRPQVNFKQGDNDKDLVLPPGPNGPVGSVWISLSKPTFGIHGTPEPSTVSKSASHGCVRLTNWDAEDLASMTKPGVKVDFVD